VIELIAEIHVHPSSETGVFSLRNRIPEDAHSRPARFFKLNTTRSALVLQAMPFAGKFVESLSVLWNSAGVGATANSKLRESMEIGKTATFLGGCASLDRRIGSIKGNSISQVTQRCDSSISRGRVSKSFSEQCCHVLYGAKTGFRSDLFQGNVGL
jgi:hypothetical protein